MRTTLALVSLATIVSGCNKTDEAHCLLDEIDPDTIVSSIEVTTTTGSSGTDSDIYLDVELDPGNDMSLYLDDPSSDDFETGSVATYRADVAGFTAGAVAKMDLRKDSSLFEGGDWRLDGLTIVFVEDDGTESVAYDNPEVDELLTGDETHHLRCP